MLWLSRSFTVVAFAVVLSFSFLFSPLSLVIIMSFDRTNNDNDHEKGRQLVEAFATSIGLPPIPALPFANEQRTPAEMHSMTIHKMVMSSGTKDDAVAHLFALSNNDEAHRYYFEEIAFKLNSIFWLRTVIFPFLLQAGVQAVIGNPKDTDSQEAKDFYSTMMHDAPAKSFEEVRHFCDTYVSFAPLKEGMQVGQVSNGLTQAFMLGVNLYIQYLDGNSSAFKPQLTRDDIKSLHLALFFLGKDAAKAMESLETRALRGKPLLESNSKLLDSRAIMRQYPLIAKALLKGNFALTRDLCIEALGLPVRES